MSTSSAQNFSSFSTSIGLELVGTNSNITTLSTNTGLQFVTVTSNTNSLSTSIGVEYSSLTAITLGISTSIFQKTSTLFGVNTPYGTTCTAETSLFNSSNLVLWSSATFSVPFFSLLPSNAYVEIQYKPSFAFNTPVSSFLTNIVTTLSNSEVILSNSAGQNSRSRPIVFYSIFSNIYTDTIQISIDASTLKAAALTPFTIYHSASNASTDGFTSAPTIISYMDSYATTIRVENPQRL